MNHDEWLRRGTATWRGLKPNSNKILMQNAEQLQFEIELQESRRGHFIAFHRSTGEPVRDATRSRVHGSAELVEIQLQKIFERRAEPWAWKFQQNGRTAPNPLAYQSPESAEQKDQN